MVTDEKEIPSRKPKITPMTIIIITLTLSFDFLRSMLQVGTEEQTTFNIDDK